MFFENYISRREAFDLIVKETIITKIKGKTIDELILLCVDDNLEEIEINNRLGIKCCPLILRLDYQNDIAYLELEKHIKAIFNSLENILIA